MSPKRKNPSLNCSYDQVYRKLLNMPNHLVENLITTGGTNFCAKALETRDGRQFIALPHNNRIYKEDWGFSTNHMGKEGQRIGHYARPLDEWCFD